jgi:anti-sigma B factor antagonist
MLSVKVDGQAVDPVICRLAGELDLYTVCDFRQALADLPSGSRVVIDMSGLSFVDSSGLGALVGGVRRTRDRGGDVAVACARPALSRLLRTIGLHRLLTVSDDIEQATAALRGTTMTLRGAV